MLSKASNVNASTASGLVAILLWSATFAVARSLSEQIGPITAGAAVYLGGGAMLWILRVFRSKGACAGVRWSYRHWLFGCGALFALYTTLIYLAVGMARSREQVLEIALLNYLWPALTILLSLPLLNTRAGLMLGPGTVLALAGIFFVMTQGADVSWQGFWNHWRGNPVAYCLALAAAVSWALYSNLTRRWAEPESDGAVDWFIPVTGVILLLIRLCSPEPATWGVRAIGEALVLGGITALAYALWEVAMRKGNLLLVAVCSYFTPLLSTLVSCVYLEIVPGPRLWIGCLLLVAGSILSWKSVSRPSGQPT